MKSDFIEACQCCSRYYAAISPCYGEDCEEDYSDWQFNEARFKEGAK